MFMILETYHFQFKFLYKSDLRIYSTGKHLIVEKRQYGCESGISSFTWRATWDQASSPFKIKQIFE